MSLDALLGIQALASRLWKRRLKDLLVRIMSRLPITDK